MPCFLKITVLISCMLCLSVPHTGAQPHASDNGADSLLRHELVRISRLYSLDSAALASYDKIITADREVYVGRIHNITFSEVRFTCPPDNKLMALNRSSLSQILYSNGRRDVFMPLDDPRVRRHDLVDTNRIIVKTQKDWMKVKVTEDPDEVTFLLPLGEVDARYEGDIGNMSNEDLVRHAAVILKKKAAARQAHCVLIESKFFRKPYGELPVVEVTGRMFGYK
jgi:hypothetical protein